MNRNKTRIKNRMMKTAAISLGTVMTLSSAVPAWAATADTQEKDENVYVTLQDNGDVSSVYVVNEYTSDQKKTITDYGNYSSVKNLSTNETLTQNGDKITFQIPKGKFYYQGEAKNTDIPWNIQISYFLDGKKISADDLAGKSGHLKICIKTSENKACNSTFFENYLLQTTVVLDTECCTNIVADGATAGNVGKNRQLLYNIMAGQEKTIDIEADVTSFEMDGITFKGVPMGFDVGKDQLDTSSIKKQTADIKEAVSSLNEGAEKLQDGISGALNGSESLSNGAAKLAAGTTTLSNGTSSLQEGSASLLSGTMALHQGIESYLTGTNTLVKGLTTYTNGVNTLANGMKQLGKLSDLGQISKAVTTISDQVNGKKGTTLASGSHALTTGLGNLKKQVDAFAKSDDLKQIQQLSDGVKEIQTNLQTLSTQAESLGKLLAADAQAAGALATEQQQILQDLSAQAKAANEQIASEKQNIVNHAKTVNSQIDQAVAAIDASVESGAISQAEAEGLKAKLNASRVETSIEDKEIQIQMPAQNEQVAKQAALLTQSATQLSQAATGFKEAAEKLGKAAEQMQVSDQTSNTIAGLQAAVTSAYQGAASLEKGIDQLGKGLDTLEGKTDQLPEAVKGISALQTGASKLQSNSQSLLQGAQKLQSNGGTLQTGSATLVTGMTEANTGIKTLSDGVLTLKNNTDVFLTGANQLTSGMQSLYSGSKQLTNGTAEFQDQTKDIDEKIDSEVDKVVDKISGSDYKPVSFASSENKNVSLVQFAIRTDDIKAPKVEKTETNQKQETFWDKVKGLFS